MILPSKRASASVTPPAIDPSRFEAPFPSPPPVAVLPEGYRQPPDREHLFSSLYQLIDRQTIDSVLRDTDSLSQRIRRLPAHEVVWLTIAQSWFADRSVAKVYRHLHPSSDDPQPVHSSFTEAKQRLGCRPMKLLFHRVCRPLAVQGQSGLFHRHWLIVALDGSVFEAPDTRANRAALGSASNQHGEGAFPQLRLAALCEIGTHAITDVEIGSYGDSEQKLGTRLLRRLPSGRLVLMDRGLSYFELIATVRRRRSHVLARVKAKQRDLPVEGKVLSDGSYRSTIYPSSNAKRSQRGGLSVRVIRYRHRDPLRNGCGEESCLITTILSVEDLSAQEAVRIYPFRWQEESVFSELKQTLLANGRPLLRSKTPQLLVAEVYGLLLGHYVVRRLMAQSWGTRGPEVRLSFKECLEVLEDRLGDPADSRWLPGLWREMARQKLRQQRPRRYARVVKAGRGRWPSKKNGTPPLPQPKKHLHEIVEVIKLPLTDGH